MSFNFQIESQVKVYANSGAFPATGLIRTIYIDKANDTAYYWDDATNTYKSLGGGGTGSVVWGAITGTLADQTDLQNALNAKVPYSGATSNVDLGEYQIKVGQLELDQTPTGTTGIAKIRWNDTDGTIDVGLKGGNVTLQVGLEELIRVVNKSGATLAESAYQAVRVRLVSEGGAAGQRLAVVLAQANNDLNSATTIGLVTESIANNEEGFINRGGEVRGINTTGSLQGETWVDGDILYLSPTTPGAITNIKPTAPNHSIVLGYVVYSHAVNGKIFVKVDNGYELEELHNVTATDYDAPVDADSLLIYQSSESLWKRLTWANIKAKLKTYFDTVYQAVLVSGTNIKTVNSTSLLGSGDVSVGVTSINTFSPLASTGGATPTLSISEAGTSGDGYLNSTDWNTFNNKQAPLVSGTNIKTINGNSVLGSGNIAVQPTLVSGTNIKTINGSSVLGSGDLAIASSGLQGFYNFIKPQVGQTVNNRFITVSSSFNTYSNNIIRLHPYLSAYTITSTTLTIQVLTGQAGALGRILIYSDLNGFPDTKLYESANLNLSTSGFKTATTAFTFTAGITYWIGFQNFLTSTSASITSILNNQMIQFLANPTSNGGYTGYETTAYAFGTAPTTMGAVTGTDQSFPLILIKL